MLTAKQLLTFAAVYSLHIHSSGSPTLGAVSNSHQIPKDTNLHQKRCANLHCRQPTFYRISQFQSLAQILLSAAYFTANVTPTGNLCFAASPGH